MRAQWTGEMLGKMHIHSITAKELAKKSGYNPKYLSAVFNGRRNPKGIEAKLHIALDEIIVERQKRDKW